MAREFINQEKYRADDATFKELQANISGLISNYRQDMGALCELLKFQSQFYRYSARNSMLIYKQNPYASFVGSFKFWKDMGYSVLKGQHGMKILLTVDATLFKANGEAKRLIDATPEQRLQIENHQLKTETVKRLKVGTVFDISQTNCPPEDYPKVFSMGYNSGQHAELFGAVRQYAENCGLHVLEQDLQSISLRGLYKPETEEIVLNHRLLDTERLSTLTHELGHGLLHSLQSCGCIPEFEADIFSTLAHQHFGIKVPEGRMDHMKENFELCNTRPEFSMITSLDRAGRAYKAMCESIDPVMEQRLHPELMQEQAQAVEQSMI